MDNLTLAPHNQKLSLWIERIKEYQPERNGTFPQVFLKNYKRLFIWMYIKDMKK